VDGPRICAILLCPRRTLAVVRFDHVHRAVEGNRRNPDIGTCDLPQNVDQSLVFRNRRWKDYAEQFLSLHEIPHVRVETRRAPIAGPHHELVGGSVQRVENAPLDADHVLRTRVVVDQADEEGSAEGQGLRLRVGSEIVFLDEGPYFLFAKRAMSLMVTFLRARVSGARRPSGSRPLRA
jgi:hypothetical protein